MKGKIDFLCGGVVDSVWVDSVTRFYSNTFIVNSSSKLFTNENWGHMEYEDVLNISPVFKTLKLIGVSLVVNDHEEAYLHAEIAPLHV